MEFGKHTTHNSDPRPISIFIRTTPRRLFVSRARAGDHEITIGQSDTTADIFLVVCVHNGLKSCNFCMGPWSQNDAREAARVLHQASRSRIGLRKLSIFFEVDNQALPIYEENYFPHG